MQKDRFDLEKSSKGDNGVSGSLQRMIGLAEEALPGSVNCIWTRVLGGFTQRGFILWSTYSVPRCAGNLGTQGGSVYRVADTEADMMSWCRVQ